MSQAITIKDAEFQTLRLAMFKDGLWDIFLGCTLISFSFYMVTRSALGPALNLLLIAGIVTVLGVAFYVARRQFVQPRIGRVTLGPAHQAKLRAIHIVTMGLVVATLAIFLFTALLGVGEPTWGEAPQWLRDFDIDILFSVLSAGLFAFASYMLGIPRLVPYGWLLGGTILSSAVLDVYYGYTFHFPTAIAGGIMLVVGCVMFGRFLRQYPVPSPEA